MWSPSGPHQDLVIITSINLWMSTEMVSTWLDSFNDYHKHQPREHWGRPLSLVGSTQTHIVINSINLESLLGWAP